MDYWDCYDTHESVGAKRPPPDDVLIPWSPKQHLQVVEEWLVKERLMVLGRPVGEQVVELLKEALKKRAIGPRDIDNYISTNPSKALE